MVSIGAVARGDRIAKARQMTDDLPGATYKAWIIAASAFAASPDFAFEQNEECVRGIAFVYQYVSRRESEFLRVRREPLQLIIAEVGKNLNLAKRCFNGLAAGWRDHDTLLKY